MKALLLLFLGWELWIVKPIYKCELSKLKIIIKKKWKIRKCELK